MLDILKRLKLWASVWLGIPFHFLFLAIALLGRLQILGGITLVGEDR